MSQQARRVRRSGSGRIPPRSAAAMTQRKNYLDFSLGTLDGPSGHPRWDAKRLVSECLKRLSRDEFPPRLFVLWLTPEFKPYDIIVAAVSEELARQGLGDVPVIGTSAAVVWFGGRTHEKGAVLSCLASRLVHVRVAHEPHADVDPKKAVRHLCQNLGLSGDRDVNPRGNRSLMLYLPGYLDDGDPAKYRAAEILDHLKRNTFGQLHMFGGVSSDGPVRGKGSQFLNGQVHQRTAVAALVTSDIVYGIGINDGLVSTGEYYQVERVDDSGQIIQSFKGADLSVIGKRWRPDPSSNARSPEVLAIATSAQRDILAPQYLHGDLHVQRKVKPGTILEVMRPSPDRLMKSVKELEHWTLHSFRLKRPQIVGVLQIGCVSRYVCQMVNVKRNLELTQQAFPRCRYAGCYLDGEIGIDNLGRPKLSNWSLSEALWADEVPDKSEYFLGFQAHKALRTNHCSLQEAMDCVLKSVEELGYSGGMISLVLDDQDSRWIVAQKAFGRQWPAKVMPLTRRPLSGDDVLARVFKNGQAIFVADAQDPETDHGCDPRAAAEGDVVSFYAIPILGADRSPVAVLQVDLGDLRSSGPSETQKMVLDSVGALAGQVLNRAIDGEELRLTRKFDDALNDCLGSRTVPEASAHFVTRISQILGTWGYVRLLTPDRQALELVGGIGDYHDVAQQSRKVVPLDDEDSSTVATFEARQRRVIKNVIAQSAAAVRLRARYAGGSTGNALDKIKSFAIFLIPDGGDSNEESFSGVIDISSTEEWFFTQSRLRSLDDVMRRFSLLLRDIRQREELDRSHAQIRFLADTTPILSGDLNVYAALREQAKIIRVAAQADVVSYFLWCDLQDRYVLRGQDGWGDSHWQDSAWFNLGEGLAGTLAQAGEVRYLAHVQLPEGKYDASMFGDAVRAGQAVEAIALPLTSPQSRRPLGIVMLHRYRPPAGLAQSGFATTDIGQLAKVAASQTAFVEALQQHDMERWTRAEVERIKSVAERLQKKVAPSQLELLREFSRAVIELYRFSWCSIIWKDPDGKLRPLACEMRHGNQDSADFSSLDWAVSAKAALITRKPQVLRSAAASDPANPREVGMENLVYRVFLPFQFQDGTSTAVIDLGWCGKRRNKEQLLPHHDLEKLKELACRLQDALHLQTQNEKARQATQDLDQIGQQFEKAYHGLINDIKDLHDGLESALYDSDDQTSRENIEIAYRRVKGIKGVFKKITEDGNLQVSVEKQACSIGRIISRSIEERTDGYRVIPSIDDSVEVWAPMHRLANGCDRLIENAFVHSPPGTPIQVNVSRDGDDCTVEIVNCQETSHLTKGSQIGQGMAKKVVQTFTGSFHAGPDGHGLYVVQFRIPCLPRGTNA